MNKRRVVVTGIGVVSPLGMGVEAYWQALLAGKNGVERITAFDPSGFDSQLAGEIKALKTADYVPKAYRKSARLMARDIELAVAAAYLAVKDAGLITKCLVERGENNGQPLNLDPTRFGANIGAGLICADLTELAGALSTTTDSATREFSLKRWGEGGTTTDGGQFGMGALTPLWLLKFLPNMLACHVTIVHDCQAPSNTITCGEASSHLAIGEAARTIERGGADVCICGGAESKLNPMGLLRQSLLKRLSQTGCRPFAQDRDGTVISEGGALLILEEYEHAKRRGARVYAEVVGFGAGTDIGEMERPSPDGRGTASAARKALADAGLTGQDVDLAVAFGVGTKEHDSAEAAGLKTILAERWSDVPVTTTKGGQGNNGAGAGALDLAAGVLALYHQQAPPTVGTGCVADEGPPGLVLGPSPQAGSYRAVLSTSAALGAGQNAAIVLKKT